MTQGDAPPPDDETGPLLGLLRVLRDDVEHLRRRAGDARHSIERGLIESIGPGVIVQRADLAIDLVSSHAQKLLGGLDPRGPGEGVKPEAFMIDESGAPFEAERWPARVVARTGQPSGDVVVGVPTSDLRGQRWLLVSSVPHSDNGDDLPRIVTTLVDISERKRFEASFLQAQKLEVTASLAGGLAHDFNNLLSVITTSTELALDQLERGHPAVADIQSALDAAERAASLTRQLLIFSRKQAGLPRVVQLRAIVGGMQKLLRRLLGERIELQLHLDEGLWPVRIDPVHVEQLIANLAVNSRDAMPNGGVLRVMARNLPGEGASGDRIELLISDDGCGMPEHVRERCFEPFFTTKTPERGTGLGLATVLGIVKQVGGDIAVESLENVGTTFLIKLPRAHEPSASTRPPPVSRRTAVRYTVLLVEDDSALRRSLSRMLDLHGFRVLTARTGDEAVRLAKASTSPLHLVLTDVVLPGMSGVEVADAVEAIWPGSRVLYMSGHPVMALENAGADPGSTHFLQKPFTEQSLLEKLADMLDEG